MRFGRFAALWLPGWLLDAVVLSVLTVRGSAAFLANCQSAWLSVVPAFWLAERFVFRGEAPRSSAGRLGTFAATFLFNAPIVFVASVGIGLVTNLSMPLVTASAGNTPTGWVVGALGAKVLLTPLSIGANFLFLRGLLERRSAH